MINTNLFICQLPQTTQDLIRKDIKTFLIKNEYDEIDEIIENAMSGRLCDLEDSIDISKYIEL